MATSWSQRRGIFILNITRTASVPLGVIRVGRAGRMSGQTGRMAEEGGFSNQSTPILLIAKIIYS